MERSPQLAAAADPGTNPATATPARDAEPRHRLLALDRWMPAFLVVGVVLRVVRYLTCQPLWGDEAFLAASFIDRGFADMLEPLEYHQVAPVLFLWIELAMVRLLGFSEWALRLFPLVAGIASLFLMRHLARLCTRGPAAVLAVAFLAVALYPVRFASEVKPYASDLMTALGLMVLALHWARDPGRTRWLWLLAGLTPLALALSHPAVFVAGGLAAALLPRVVRERRARTWVAYAAWGLSMVASFLVLLRLVTEGQAQGAGDGTWAYWKQAFPPLDTPWRIPLWLLNVHTSHMFSYPIGEANGGSIATTALVITGIVLLVRSGRRLTLGPLLAPFGLGLLAAFLKRYPYGGSARTMQYVAPSICLLAGIGLAWLLNRSARPSIRARSLRAGFFVLATIGIAVGTRDVLQPYKFREDRVSRGFARHFWTDQAQFAELVCVKTDLGVEFDPQHWERGRSAVYLCQQAIYSPRHHRGQPPAIDRVSPARPLRCVLYNADLHDPSYREWMSRMLEAYELARTTRFEPVPLRKVGGLPYEDRYDVLEFVPRGGPDALARRQAVTPAAQTPSDATRIR
jgi:hypothetical protein